MKNHFSRAKFDFSALICKNQQKNRFFSDFSVGELIFHFLANFYKICQNSIFEIFFGWMAKHGFFSSIWKNGWKIDFSRFGVQVFSNFAFFAWICRYEPKIDFLHLVAPVTKYCAYFVNSRKWLKNRLFRISRFWS